MEYQENLARRFKPAGFEQPEGSRHEYKEISSRLQENFYQWMEELPEDVSNHEKQYRKARRLIADIKEITAKEANSLLAGFKPKKESEKKAGLFISACYNQCPDDIIILDFDAEDIDYIGYRLGSYKVLMNNGKAGDNFAAYYSGVVVRNAETGDCGMFSRHGMLIDNVGDVYYLTPSIFLDTPNACYNFSWIEHGRNPYILYADTVRKVEGRIKENAKSKRIDLKKMPKLKKYMRDIGRAFRSMKDEESARKFIERYGRGGRRIKPEIKKIIREEKAVIHHIYK